MIKLLCKLGFHKKHFIVEDFSREFLAGRHDCKRCGKNLSKQDVKVNDPR